MAKRKKTISVKNAVLDLEKMTITEVTKEEEKEYSIAELLSVFEDDINIALNITVDNEI